MQLLQPSHEASSTHWGMLPSCCRQPLPAQTTCCMHAALHTSLFMALSPFSSHMPARATGTSQPGRVHTAELPSHLCDLSGPPARPSTAPCPLPYLPRCQPLRDHRAPARAPLLTPFELAWCCAAGLLPQLVHAETLTPQLCSACSARASSAGTRADCTPMVLSI